MITATLYYAQYYWRMLISVLCYIFGKLHRSEMQRISSLKMWYVFSDCVEYSFIFVHFNFVS